jgi:hypothetical protein
MTDPIRAIDDPRQSEIDEPEHGRIAIQIPYDKLALGLELHVVDNIRSLRDSDVFPVTQ